MSTTPLAKTRRTKAEVQTQLEQIQEDLAQEK